MKRDAKAMSKKILIVSGSPKKEGNTSLLVKWFTQGAASKGACVEIAETASLKYKSHGCLSCRACQKKKAYECSINDGVTSILKKMAQADVIVLATPLYFFSASAQLKAVTDRMFSLYKWDNEANTMETPLKGRALVVLASAYEDIGLEALEKPFKLTADYTGMKFASLIIANAGVSGQIGLKKGIREKVIDFGAQMA